MKYAIGIDEEYNAEVFWDAAHELHDLLARFVLIEEGKMLVDASEKDLLFKALATLPGWANGPHHAESPVTVTEVE